MRDIVLTTEQIDDVVTDLVGTTGSLEATLRDVLGDETVKDIDIARESLRLIDDQVFVCEYCGWWCSTDDEGNEENVCEECEMYN